MAYCCLPNFKMIRDYLIKTKDFLIKTYNKFMEPDELLSSSCEHYYGGLEKGVSSDNLIGEKNG